MPGPTNKQLGLTHIDADTEAAARRMCAAQGCTCGDRLEITITELDSREAERQGLPPGGKHSAVQVQHSNECPLLARMQTN